MFWIEYKTTTENKNTTNEYRYFPESNFVGVKRLLVLTFPSNQDDDARRFKTWRYYVPKSAIKNYNIIINRNNFYDQPIDSDIKRYEEIIKLITGQGDDYTIWCLLDYEYIKSHHRLIAVGLSRQKELNDPNAIQHIEFSGPLKNTYCVNAGGTQSIFVLMNLEKIKDLKNNKKLWRSKTNQQIHN